MKNYASYFEAHTEKLVLTSRGGGIEVTLPNGSRMTAYQNYLGGGMLGSIANDCTDPKWRGNKYYEKYAKALREYFYGLMEHDEYNSYESLQKRPLSAY